MAKTEHQTTGDSREGLGQAIKDRREALGLSQEHLARLADVSRSTIQNLETGRTVKAYRLRNIAEVLDVTVEDLILDHGRQAAEPGPPPPDLEPRDDVEREIWAETRVAEEIRRAYITMWRQAVAQARPRREVSLAS